MFKDLLDLLKEYPAAGPIVGVIVGGVLTFFIPYLWKSGGRAGAWVLGKLSGHYEHREFEKQYLDWVITSLQDLKLAGVVPNEEAAKRPRLEQVFVSLHVAEQPSQGATSEDVDFLAERILTVQATTDEPDIAERLRAHLASLDEAERKKLRHALLQPASTDATELVREVLAASLSRSASPHEPSDASDQLKKLLREHARIAILGAPGSGKTSLLQYIALAFARHRPGDSKLREPGLWRGRLGYQTWHMPLFVPLGVAASILAEQTALGNYPSFLEILLQMLSPELRKHKAAAEYFADQLDNGKCIVLLDGLDEIAKDDEFQATVRALQGFITRYNKNQFLVTSRNTSRVAGWHDGAGSDFRAFYVSDLTEKQIDTFINIWCVAVGLNEVRGRLQDESEAERRAREWRTEERAARLRAALRESPPIRRLAKNPMLLSIIASVHRSPLQELRLDRSALYRQCSTLLLEQWDVHKGVRVDDTGLRLQQKEAVMRQLAIRLHDGRIGDHEGGRDVKRKDVEIVIAGMLPELKPIDGADADEEASRLLNRLIERSGLLVERRRGVLTFAHHTFQEYYSALSLALDVSEKNPDENRDFLLNPARLSADWWREVVLLYVGTVPDASDFLERVGDAKADDLCQQRLRLAAACLGEKPTIKRRAVRQDLTDRLLSMRSDARRTPEADRFLDQLTDYLITWSRGSEWHNIAAYKKVLAAQDEDEEQRLAAETLKLFDDRRSIFRKAALYAAASFPDKPQYQAVRDKATALLADSDIEIRQTAFWAAKHFGADSTIPLLVEGVRDSNYNIRTKSVEALVKLADRLSAPQEAVGHLETLPKDNALRVYEAVKILTAYRGAMDDEQIALFVNCALREARNDSDSARTFMSGLLRGEKSDVVLQIVQEQVEGASGELLRAAMAVLGSAAAQAPGAIIDHTTRHFTDPDYATRRLSSDILQDLARNEFSAEVLAAITPLLEHADPLRRAGALRALQAIPAADVTQAVARQVLRSCKDAHTEVRRAAAEALRAVEAGALAQEKIDALLQLTKDAEAEVRLAAIESIAAPGRDCSDARVSQALLKALSDESELVRTATANAIGTLGGKSATPKLIDRLLQSLRRPGLAQRLWKARKAPPPRGGSRPSWEILDSERYKGSYEAAAAEAIASLEHDTEPDRLVRRLMALAAKKKNGPVRWYALAAMGLLVKGDRADATFDRLIRLVEQEPDLVGPWGQREWANTVIGHLLDASPHHWDSTYRLRHGENPLAALWKHLPKDAQIARLADFLGSQQPHLRELGLRLVAENHESLGQDRVNGWVERASGDSNESVRRQALQTAKTLLRVGPWPKVFTAVADCLTDDNEEIREVAWGIVSGRFVAEE
jgi:HEAT repeat protein